MPKKTKKQKVISKHGKILASWSFPEHVQQKKGTMWYICASIIAAGLLVYSILTANILFALIIILVVIILIFSSKKESLKIEFKITEDGLEIGESFYSYKDIKNFWIIYEPPEVKDIYFDFGNMLKPRMSIPLKNKDPLKIRKILLEYLEEDLTKESEPLSDYLKRTFKF